ncbi:MULTISPECIES: transglutaminase-like domain-containing protein [Rhodomicrobium]|uniref:transglutaminase-like domain-containing protein n=1 Tax=Rhodomicrobium TaxID=1068 RepID=UPI000B4B3688|nr:MULTISPECIES: transglutaminase-like domain-containing protein [Rhodomicrobium]
MHRRDFLKFGAALAGAALLPHLARAQERFIVEQGAWRKFEIISRLSFARPTRGRLQAWVPVPSIDEDSWAKPLGSDWRTNAKIAKLETDPASGAEMVYFEWPDGDAAPVAEVSSEASTRSRLTEFAKPRRPVPLTAEERRRYTASTTTVPIESQPWGAAAAIVENAKTDLGKAMAVYEWLVAKKTCGAGDLAALSALTPAVESDAAPRCSRLNGLYVALVRALGLPARSVYGVRVAPSQFGFASLGAASDDITHEEHCRAEVWLEDYGWVPVDPGDARRVAEHEPPEPQAGGEPKAVAARVTLFGACEGNWIAYNNAADIVLPHSAANPIPFLTRPLAQTADARLGDGGPEGFAYKVTVRELPA